MVYDGTIDRQLIAADDQKVVVSVKLLDQHRVVKELVGPKFHKGAYPDASGELCVDNTRLD